MIIQLENRIFYYAPKISRAACKAFAAGWSGDIKQYNKNPLATAHALGIETWKSFKAGGKGIRSNDLLLVDIDQLDSAAVPLHLWPQDMKDPFDNDWGTKANYIRQINRPRKVGGPFEQGDTVIVHRAFETIELGNNYRSVSLIQPGRFGWIASKPLPQGQIFISWNPGGSAPFTAPIENLRLF